MTPRVSTDSRREQFCIRNHRFRAEAMRHPPLVSYKRAVAGLGLRNTGEHR